MTAREDALERCDDDSDALPWELRWSPEHSLVDGDAAAQDCDDELPAAWAVGFDDGAFAAELAPAAPVRGAWAIGAAS